MSKTILGLIVGLIAGTLITFSVVRRSPEAAKKQEEKESVVQRGTNSEVFLKLDKERQEKIGLKTAALEAAQLRPELKGYGQVLDPAPYAALLIENLSAQASLQASSNEYQRLKTLHAQDQNISTRVFETAEAAMKRDQLLLEGAKTKFTLSLGQIASAQSNLQAFIDSLISLKHGLVRIDLPLGESVESPPEAARLASLAAEEHPMPARFLGVAPLAAAQTQGQGFLFLVETNPPPPGTAMVGWLQTRGESQTGIVMPRAALIRHQGEVYVYVQTSEETFERKQVELERPLHNGWFVRGGVTAKDRIVIAGAQQLFSEELKTADAPEAE